MIDSMAYFDGNYLLSTYFKAPVCEVGLVLLLGQLPLARSYQVQKGFSCSPFCTRKYLPCLVVPVNRLIKARPLANIAIRHSLWERR